MNIQILTERLEREKTARRAAESILEKKSRDLYETNARLQDLADNLILQHAISSILINAQSPEVAIHAVLQKMCDVLQMKMGNMWEVEKSQSVLYLYDSYYLNEPKLQKFYEICQRFTFSAGIGLPGRVYQNNMVCEIDDVTKDNNFPRAPYAAEAGLHAAFAFPLRVENRVVGVIEFFNEKIMHFSNSLLSLIDDISNQLAVFLEKEQTRKNMLNIQRVAGIAEVTTGMLHNMGNILNSVNISLSVLANKFKYSKLSNLLLMRDLLKSHEHDFSTFILTTEQGKHLPDYLIELANYWENMHSEVHHEMNSLAQGVQHISDILHSQQNLSAVLSMVEPLQINALLEEAVRVNVFITHINMQCIKREYAEMPLILVDRNKLLQIIVNLIRNAVHAVEKNILEPKIILKTQIQGDQICIQVSDNGYGIEKSNLDKIFSHGFSTKEGGHGFGLHTSALFAQEMGGSLTASSRGVGQGATFVLLLPMKKGDLKES